MRVHQHTKLQFWIIIAMTISIAPLAIIGSTGVNWDSNSNDSSSNTGNPNPSSTGPTDRVVLAELFTAASCTFCPTSSSSIDRLSDEYGPERLAVIEYHTWTSDPLSNADSRARKDYYGVSGIPDMYFDGTLRNGGGGSGKYFKYESYKSSIEGELEKLTNIVIAVSGDINTTGGTIDVHIEATDYVTETNLTVRYALWEDDLYHKGTETEGPHRNNRFLLRDMLPDDNLTTISSPGDAADFSKAFIINSNWNITPDARRIGVVTFVQSDTDKQVLQAATYDFIPQEILLVPDAGNGDNTIEEHYQNILTHEGYSFDSWNILDPLDSASYDEKGFPTFEHMSNYHAVIWFTYDATSTLSETERTNIGNYLDNDGNLFISGENIGSDADTNGWNDWYQSYLHATFMDNTHNKLVDGVSGDPIGDGLTDLDIIDDSPSIVDPRDGGLTPFKYHPSGKNASVRVDHDLNTRIVYFAFNYFEGTDTEDTDTDDETIMNRIIKWLDGSTPPNITIIQPNGGEVLTSGQSYDIKWDAGDVNITDSISIYYCTNSSSPEWVLISSDEPNDGVYNWTVPSENSTKCRLKITAVDSQNQIGEKISSADFTIRDIDVEPPTNINAKLEKALQDVNITWTLSKDDGAGVKDVKNYAIYYGTTYDSDGISYNFLAEIENGTTFFVHENAGDGDSNDYFYYVQANDTYDNSNWSNQAGKFVREMQMSRQLISFPLVQSNTALTTVLQTIEGSYNYVQWYDPLDTEDHWVSHSTLKPSGFNDLLNIDHKMAVWINMTAFDNLTIAGRVPQKTSIQLFKDWNFIGYPSFIDKNISETLDGIPYDQVEGFEENAPPHYLRILKNEDNMTAGYGYWIHVTSDCILTVFNVDIHVAPPMNINARLNGFALEDINITWSLSKDDNSGQNDVENYAIYYGTTYDSSGVSYILLDEVSNGTSFYLHKNAGDGDPNNYFYYVQANDTSGNTNWSSQAGKFVREMQIGKQLISIPLVQSDTALTTVLQTIEGNYDYVQWYDATDDHWKTHSIDKPADFNDLLNVDHRIALWITMTSPDNLTVAGIIPGSTTIQLYKGWNFVGYPSFTNRTVSNALNGLPYEQIEGFDESASPYYLKLLSDSDVMTTGNGYWIKVTEDCSWII